MTGIVALVYAGRQLRQARESAKIQHLLGLITQFENDPLVGIRKTLAEKRLKDVPEPQQMDNILNFFETVGLLVRKNYLDLHDVWSSFSYWMFNMYADFREYIDQEQKNDPTYYSDFSTLVERLRTVERKEHGNSDRPSKEDVRGFWKEESEIIPGMPVPKRRKRSSGRSATAKTS